MNIQCPQTGTRRALLIIDVQPATFDSVAAQDVADTLRRYVEHASYAAYLVASFCAPENSMFFRQLRWTLSAAAAGPTDAAILHAVAARHKPTLHIEKTVRSIFKGEQGALAKAFLDEHGIDEVHLAGLDINDCVLATAYDALDQGYFTYAIEECCGRTDADRHVIDAALTVLRKQAMTNNSTRHAAATVLLP
ncbi:MAG: cysteine hydrolase family protein [Janthinobacterium lividum]